MTAQVEEVANVMAVEIGVRHDIDAQTTAELVRAAAGELPIIARIPLDRALDLGCAAFQAGAAAVSLGPPRGVLPGPDGALVAGRLYSPALFPQALAIVGELVKLEIPVIGAGGVYEQQQADTMLAAGALAVPVDTVLWR